MDMSRQSASGMHFRRTLVPDLMGIRVHVNSRYMHPPNVPVKPTGAGQVSLVELFDRMMDTVNSAVLGDKTTLSCPAGAGAKLWDEVF